ncbi:MAG: sodium:solute symporter family protein [Planctomycetota bacterium]
MNDDHTLHGIFVLVYLVALIGVGAMKARKIKSQEDFALAGRGLSTFVLVGTLLATWIGTGSIFGNAQETGRIGVPALLLPIGGVLGVLFIGFLAGRIRQFGQFTIQDILEARYGVAARILATITLLSAYVIIVSYQYRAGQSVLSEIFGYETDPATGEVLMSEGEPVYLVGRTAGIWIVAAFIVIYTALAGMFSVAYTDVVNGILMTIGILAAIPFLLSEAGGLDAAIAALPAGQQSITDHWNVALILSAVVPPLLLLLGDANMYQRFFSAKTVGSARSSAMALLVGVLVLECAIIFVALLGSSLVHQGKLIEPRNPAHIVVFVAFKTLPPFLGAILVATIVAIVVSTADSFLLAPATSVVRDLYQRFIAPDASERQLVIMGRVVVVVLGLISLLLAFQSKEFFRVALFAYTLYGASLTPAMLAAFFWKRANLQGAVASILTGAIVSYIWYFDRIQLWTNADGEPAGIATYVQQQLDTEGIEAVIPALPLSVLALVIVSLLTKPPTELQSNAI